ncbi:hypothetical protein BJ170DRAFT_317857 [Xylariales sp. AK1849]|nr:hypothetical protein BJ170DRAFT_317857 [Xylariales sp. AK1849]
MNDHPGGRIGKRLLPVIIDEVAHKEPSRVWASLPIDDYDLSQGFEDITYAVFANGINKLAHCIVAAFGPSKTFETIIYLGIPDIRYYMLLYAVCKTGHKVLFSSHLNTLDMHLSLMDQTDCQAMLLAHGVYADDILAKRPVAKAEIPELDDLLDIMDLATPFPYTKSFEEAEKEPFVVCHTSGNTGPPKPVIFTNASMATMDAQTALPDVDGRGHWTWQGTGVGKRYLMAASPFHPIAVVLAMTVSAFGGGILIPGFRHRPVTDISETCGIIKYSGCTEGFMPYYLADTIARMPDAEDYIRRFDSVSYGNGTISDFAGQMWSKHVRFRGAWGASETLTPPNLEADPEDYAYVYFDVDAGGLVFRERDLEYFDDDGSRIPLYELIMTFSPKSQSCASYWANLGITAAPSQPPYPEYPTAEVWTPHPDPKKARYAWRFISRLYDLDTGTSEFSIAMEKTLGQHEKVQNAIVLSKNDEPPVALIELAKGITPEMAADLWDEAIEPENKVLPEQARIAKSHVILLEYRSFVRGSESQLFRRQTEEKFAGHISEVYGKGRKRSLVVERPRYESIVETVEVIEVIEN